MMSDSATPAATVPIPTFAAQPIDLQIGYLVTVLTEAQLSATAHREHGTGLSHTLLKLEIALDSLRCTVKDVERAAWAADPRLVPRQRQQTPDRELRAAAFHFDPTSLDGLDAARKEGRP